jgi:hypothetical protein
MFTETLKRCREEKLRNCTPVSSLSIEVDNTMSSKPHANPPPSFAPIDPKVWRHQLNVLAWVRIGLGALAGFLAAATGFTNSTSPPPGDFAYYGVYVAAIVYAASYYIARQFVLTNLDPKNKNKLITQGLFPFIIIFLFTWIVFNTLIYATGIQI